MGYYKQLNSNRWLQQANFPYAI